MSKSKNQIFDFNFGSVYLFFKEKEEVFKS